MQNRILLAVCAVGLACSLAARPAFAETTDALKKLAHQAISRDTNVSAYAIAALRAMGSEGLEVFIAENSDMPTADRFRSALDQISGQHDCHASHLFWYTDLDQAKAAATAAGKPILSLRLLGRLDEEYSCANSRFFRTTLYSNAEISKYLRDHFILHWKSVRPVPRITVDFGDGRKIERTITGNSIHYILDPEGNVIDVLPGLYGPAAFLRNLKIAEQEALSYATDNRSERDFHLRQYHGRLNADARAACMSDLARITTGPSTPRPNTAASPTALAAGARATGKFAVERPMLKSFEEISDEDWRKIGSLHPEDAALDSAARSLIESKVPSAREAALRVVSKTRVESPLVKMIENLQRSIAEDTVRNEYSLHSTLHEWFVNQTAPKDLDQLNAKVYAQLFLTPDSDPWLGLVPADTFTGLDANGLVQPVNQNAPTIKAIK